ncbi:uncharacterized protein LOC128849210 [Cuculus canorus]|uniref:uncharacterized protein LOC128849210 n=1 Tax=Cuculus canorus TaxID=55661 RepID=UPI0023AA6771|nr:uncharacterized protein LOC128849210 [Cuculus canorus]
MDFVSWWHPLMGTAATLDVQGTDSFLGHLLEFATCQKPTLSSYRNHAKCSQIWMHIVPRNLGLPEFRFCLPHLSLCSSFGCPAQQWEKACGITQCCCCEHGYQVQKRREAAKTFPGLSARSVGALSVGGFSSQRALSDSFPSWLKSAELSEQPSAAGPYGADSSFTADFPTPLAVLTGSPLPLALRWKWLFHASRLQSLSVYLSMRCSSCPKQRRLLERKDAAAMGALWESGAPEMQWMWLLHRFGFSGGTGAKIQRHDSSL